MKYFHYNIDNIKTVQDIEKDLHKRYKTKVLNLHPDRNQELMRENAALVYQDWGIMCEHYAYLKGLCERSPKNQKKLLYNLKLYHKTLKKYEPPVPNNKKSYTEPSVQILTKNEVDSHLAIRHNSEL